MIKQDYFVDSVDGFFNNRYLTDLVKVYIYTELDEWLQGPPRNFKTKSE